MHERRVVSGAPGELGGEANDDGVLNGILRRKVTNLLLGGVVLVDFGHQLRHLLDRKHGGVANVVEGLNSIEMSKVVHEPKVIVIGHRDVELLHELTAVTAAGHGTLNLEGSGEELFVLLLNLADDIGRVDALGIFIPVDRVELLGTSRLHVVVIEDAIQLSVLLTGSRVAGSGTESVQPLGSELVVYR